MNSRPIFAFDSDVFEGNGQTAPRNCHGAVCLRSDELVRPKELEIRQCYHCAIFPNLDLFFFNVSHGVLGMIE